MNTRGVNPLDIAVIPDTVGAVVISSAGAVVAQDWPSGAQIVHFDLNINVWANLWSTAVSIPTTNSAGTTVSSGQNIAMRTGHDHVFQIPGESTGYSITSLTSGEIAIQFWRK